jgi:hypothetical protein
MTDNSNTPKFEEVVRRYERVVYGSNHGLWFDATIKVIDDIQASCSIAGLAERGVPSAAREHWYTRLAAALTRFIADERTTLRFEELSKICRRKQAIAYIFNASGYRNMKHLLALMSLDGEGPVRLALDRAPVLLAFCGLDDMPDELMSIALTQPPDLLLILMLGWLNQRAVLTDQGEKNRALLQRSGQLIESASITDRDIPLVVNAWMYATYSSEPQKHQIKKSFNVLLGKLLAPIKSELTPMAPPSRARPRMVVAHERFITPHAMFRCYAPLIRGLGKYFELIAIVEEDQIDDGSEELFNQIIRISKKKKDLREISARLRELQPDLMYFPSLGMSHWTVLLAQLRIAPIQLMTHGHPASSMSPEIDYVYLNEISGDLEAMHSERVLVGPNTLAFDAHSDLPDKLPALIEPSTREVRVAVNSKVMKLSSRLLSICKNLKENSSIPVRFSFLPGERNMYFDGLEAAIKCQLPSADVIPYLGYDKFLEEICRCDLAFAAFPFGNTNSTVDTSLLGLPTIARRGEDSAGQTDALVLRTAGLPDSLICDTDEQYYETALRMIEDRSYREALTSGLDRAEIRRRLVENQSKQENDPFPQMVWQLYLRHQEIQQSDQRVFHYYDWLGA